MIVGEEIGVDSDLGDDHLKSGLERLLKQLDKLLMSAL